MVLRSKDEIIKSVQEAVQSASPQVRVDVEKGAFYYLSARGVAQPLADISASVERMALISTLQFPTVVTGDEALSVARAFGLTVGSGGFASGIAYVTTSRRPTGTESLTVSEGDSFGTASAGGLAFEAIETRSLTAGNADAYFNPATRRYELPVRVSAVSAGTAGNIPARTLTTIRGGARGFDGVINLVAFSGGTDAQTVDSLYSRVQQRLLGLDNFSRGGLVANIQNIDTNRIQAVALTYSSEYPVLFYRLPDTAAIDAYVLNTPNPTTVTETYIAAAAQRNFSLSNKPALGISSCQVNGEAVAASLVLDESLPYGRSTRESSYVSLAAPAAANDLVSITYTYDSVLPTIQARVDGYLNSNSGALFATDVLVRYPKTLAVTVTVTGSVLGTFDPTTVEQDVATVVGNYLANGNSDAPLLGGVRDAGDLRNLIRTQVPGISTLSIPVFCRKEIGTVVETIDIPRNSQLVVESSGDVVVKFT